MKSNMGFSSIRLSKDSPDSVAVAHLRKMYTWKSKESRKCDHPLRLLRTACCSVQSRRTSKSKWTPGLSVSSLLHGTGLLEAQLATELWISSKRSVAMRFEYGSGDFVCFLPT